MLLLVMAMVSVWAVPAHAQNEDDPPTVTIAKTADELREVSSALVYRLEADPADRPGTVFFNWTQPREGRRFPAYLSDPDSDLSDKAWQWSRADTDDGPFTVIDGATDSDYTPQSSDVGKYLKVTVTYSDGHGTGKSAEAVSQRPVRRRGC
ncbi:MAG: hypothetical protein OXI18_03905 [bacterium]|nr:hypothetical protein [bacterium]